MPYLVARAVAAEQAGYDSVWLGESPVARPRPDPLVTLSAIAARTERLTLGTAVLLPLLHHPLRLAHSLATLDRLAGGRVILGVGPGAEIPATHEELAAFGVSPNKRVDRLLEVVATCRRLWSDPDSQGVQPAATQRGGPPVWLAGNGPRMLSLTGLHFDGWLPFCPTAEVYGQAWKTVRASAAAAGRSVMPGAYLTVAIDRDQGRAHEELDRYMQAYYGLPAKVMGMVQAARAGTEAEVADWIEGFVEAGACHLVLRLAASDLGPYDDRVAGLLGRLRRVSGG